MRFIAPLFCSACMSATKKTDVFLNIEAVLKQRIMDNKPQILIVDDKPEIAKVVKIQMSAEYEVTYFPNPIAALSWMHAGNIPDLIISDFYMPEMNGLEFVRHLKASSMFSAIPVMVLSSMENSGERIELLESGAEDFILKPFNPQELKIRVRNILRKR